jgi:hypothetical protein
MILIHTNYSFLLLINHKIDLNFVDWVANSKIKKGGFYRFKNQFVPKFLFIIVLLLKKRKKGRKKRKERIEEKKKGRK